MTALFLLSAILSAAGLNLNHESTEMMNFSASDYAMALKAAIIENDIDAMRKLAGGDSGPGAPSADFLDEEDAGHSAVRSIGMRRFLRENNITILLKSVVLEHQGLKVFIAYAKTERLNKETHAPWPVNLRCLEPYVDYFACEIEVDQSGRVRMPWDFCFSESGGLYGH